MFGVRDASGAALCGSGAARVGPGGPPSRLRVATLSCTERFRRPNGGQKLAFRVSGQRLLAPTSRKWHFARTMVITVVSSHLQALREPGTGLETAPVAKRLPGAAGCPPKQASRASWAPLLPTSGAPGQRVPCPGPARWSTKRLQSVPAPCTELKPPGTISKVYTFGLEYSRCC